MIIQILSEILFVIIIFLTLWIPFKKWILPRFSNQDINEKLTILMSKKEKLEQLKKESILMEDIVKLDKEIFKIEKSIADLENSIK